MINQSLFARLNTALPQVSTLDTKFGFSQTPYRIAIIIFAIVVWTVSPVAFGQNRQTDNSNPPLTPGLTKSQIMDGWISLFDGQTMFGWKAESKANWHVKNGELRADQGDTGLLRTTSQFGDYEIRLEFKSTPTTNSGLFLHSSPNPKSPKDDCFELNIAQPDQNPFPTGSLVYRVKSDVSVDLTPEEWNSYRAVVDGPNLKMWVNDKLTVDYENPKPLGRGFIGLQFRQGPIAFRNIHLKPLNQSILFNGKDLDGWKTDQKLASEFKVTPPSDEAPGQLEMTNGKGQIESEKQFEDFVFSCHVKTNSPGLNSGVFFRCIPGELMNGYESQIQNVFLDGDRSKPADHGTGGIFRRQQARRVIGNDEEWLTKTIVAVGPHISVWVNGYQVSDWTDKRKPHANPRKGLRKEKGSIIFQGHDPTTDVSFRNIRAAELEKRFPK